MSEHVARTSGSRSWWKYFLVALLGIAIGLALFWAGRVIFRPPTESLVEESFTTVDSDVGEVSNIITLNTSAAWPVIPSGRNQAEGLLTSIEMDRGQVAYQGQTIYTVDGRPVVIAEGTWPMYRDVGEDVAGEDVAQLQRMLGATGYYTGWVDGKVGPKTLAAIKRWQKDRGYQDEETIARGDVVFVEHLPAQVTIEGEEITVGAALAGGEELVSVFPAAPKMVMYVDENQYYMIPTGTPVKMEFQGGTWDGVIGEGARDNESGQYQLPITAPDGGPICGENCSAIPTEGDTLLTTQIILQEPVSGVRVPNSVIAADASGQQYVTTAAGEKKEVTVLATAHGMSIVEGIEAGESLRLPGDGS